MTKDPLLTVKGLQVFFTANKQILQAVRGVNFSLFPGEILGIVGESGCGKSATAKALLQLFPSHSTKIMGEALFNGLDLTKLTERQMREIRGKDIGMIFQDPITSLNPTLKIESQITEGYLRHHKGASKKDAKKRALELLELVGIPEPLLRLGQYPHTLSGGMRQRIMIALALASNPKLIIADEPTTALDVTIQAQILDLMKMIKEKMGTSMILITHDLSVVAGLCDRVLVMYGGKIVESAGVYELFSSPKHPYTERLLRSIPRLDMLKTQPLVPIDGTPLDPAQNISGCTFCHRCPVAMKICGIKTPLLEQLDPGHHVACWKNEHLKMKMTHDAPN